MAGMTMVTTTFPHPRISVTSDGQGGCHPGRSQVRPVDTPPTNQTRCPKGAS